MLKIFWDLVLAVGLATLFCTSPASSAPLPTRTVLTLDAARAIVAAAEAKAKAESWPGVICVVDSEGLPIILERMDDAAILAGVELAPGKARTAALFRKPSGALEDAINGPRPAALSARGFILMRGGLPIVIDGQIIGAIGVSADTPAHDELIAKAGIAALTQ
jgi:glc operon protein GlcG